MLNRENANLTEDQRRFLEGRNSIIEQATSQINQSKMEWLQRVLNCYAVPKIKGEITPGKLKWRGIKILSEESVGNSMYCAISRYWVEQRGNQIGTPYHVEIFAKIELPSKEQDNQL